MGLYLKRGIYGELIFRVLIGLHIWKGLFGGGVRGEGLYTGDV